MEFSGAEVLSVTGDRRFVLGMGCERSASVANVLGLAIRTLAEAGISSSEMAALASIDNKFDEPAILAVAAHLAIPLKLFSAAELEAETPRLANPSELVFQLLGCHGVAEAAALAAGGSAAFLIVAKQKSAFATAAIAAIL